MIRRHVCAVLVAIIAVGLPPAFGQSVRRHAAQMPATGAIQAAFSPWDDVEGMIVSALNAARRQVLVQAYSFTSRPIAAALIAARRRGVDVRITADREQAFNGDSSRIADLAAAGIPVLLEVRYASAHNKVMVIDPSLADSAVITGSYNWTWSAQNRNAENILVVRRNPELTAMFSANWHRHAAQALPYESVREDALAPQ